MSDLTMSNIKAIIEQNSQLCFTNTMFNNNT